MLAFANARRGERDAAGNPALGERDPKFSAGSERGSDAGYDFVAHARHFERGDLFLRATEQHRIAAL